MNTLGPVAPSTTERTWVWHSTDESIAAGKISLLALAEIPFAAALYGGLMYVSPWPWMTWLSLLAAPILLLRSEASIDKGVQLLNRYLIPKDYPFAVVVVTMCLIVAAPLGAFFTIAFEHPDHGGYLPILAYFVGVTIFSSMFRADSHMWSNGFIHYIIYWIILTLLLMIAVSELVPKSFQGVVAAYVSEEFMIWPAMAISGMLVYKFVHPLEQTFEFYLGAFFRCLCVRVFATMRHPLLGVAQLPHNWRESMLVIDGWHMPEMLPRAGTLDPRLSLQGIASAIDGRTFAGFAAMLSAILVMYIPALLYRWNLKASAWLWWPLSLIVSAPYEGQTEVGKHEVVGLIAKGYGAKIRNTLAYLVAAWLSTAWLPQEFIANFNFVSELEKANQLATNFPVPSLTSIRYWLLLVATGLTIWLHVKTVNHEARGTTPDKNATPTDIARFESRVTDIGRLRLWTIAAYILTGWAIGLAIAKSRWGNAVQPLIWDWLWPWL